MPLGLAYLLRYQVCYEGDRRLNRGLTDWEVALVKKLGGKYFDLAQATTKNRFFSPTTRTHGNHVPSM